MFERYTEKARRAIFFARYEASQNGSPYIESMHVLLGILHESTALFSETGLQVSVSQLAEDCRKALPPARAVIPTSLDLPVSNECKRALEAAAIEADRLGSEAISWEHLMMGLIKVSDDVARVLQQHDVTSETLGEIAPGKEERSGIAMASVKLGAARAFVEFVCQGERIATTAGLLSSALPRTGDELVFGSPNEARRYKVLAARFHFEESPATKSSGHHWLAKVVVEMERLQG